MSGMLAEFPSWEGPGVGRIMGREHLQNPDVNRSHEPTPNPSGGGESMSRHACEFPSWEGPGVGRFMERRTQINRRARGPRKSCWLPPGPGCKEPSIL